MVLVNFYFIHAKWLTDREKVINDFKRNISKFNFRSVTIGKIETIEEFDPSDINAEIIQKNVNYSQVTEPNLTIYNNLLKNLHVYQLSNSLKHFKAYEKIINNLNDDPTEVNIILEDDILYEERIFISLEKVIRQLPVNFDLIFLGLPTNVEIKNKAQIAFQNTSEVFKILPYCDSYIISKDAAKKIYESYMPCKFLTNIQLSYLIEKHQLKSQLVYPNLFMDGSKFGLYSSSLNPNNSLMFNGEYNTVKSLLSKEQLSDQETAGINQLFKSSSIAQNPDFCYLKAQYLTKIGQYKEAQQCYEETYKKYKILNTIINHESQFLKDYIRLHKHLQIDLDEDHL
jgi:GR25 family glycosyltransferase involved in LPS biosynthesis